MWLVIQIIILLESKINLKSKKTVVTTYYTKSEDNFQEVHNNYVEKQVS